MGSSPSHCNFQVSLQEVSIQTAADINTSPLVLEVKQKLAVFWVSAAVRPTSSSRHSHSVHCPGSLVMINPQLQSVREDVNKLMAINSSRFTN